MKYIHKKDWLDYAVPGLLGLTVVAVVAVVAFLIFPFADCVGIKTSKAVGVVSGKGYSSAYDSTMVNVQRDFTYVTTTHNPETFSVRLAVDGKESSVNVYKGVWEKAKIGDMADVVYGYGRYTGWLYIKDAQFRAESTPTEVELAVKRITDKLKESLKLENEGGVK